MTGIFRGNNPLNAFLLFLYGMVLKAGWFMSPQIPVVNESSGFLYKELLDFMNPSFDGYPIFFSLITYALLFSQAMSLNHFMMNRRTLMKPSYLPAMSYLLITSFFPEWNMLSAPLIMNTLLIWMWARMSQLHTDKNPKSTLFNLGIIVSLCSFLYFPSIIFFVLILCALVLMRPFKIAEWVIGLLGIFLAWYFLFSWMFLTDRLYKFSLTGIHFSLPQFSNNQIEYAAMGLLVVSIFAGILYVQAYKSKQLVQVRKIWTLMTMFLMVSLFLPFISNSNHFEYWILATFPAAAFLSAAFFYPKWKWISVSLHWIMVTFIIYMQYFKT